MWRMRGGGSYLFPESFNLHINLAICRKLHIRSNKWPSLPGSLPLTVFCLDDSYRQAWKLNQLEVDGCAWVFVYLN